MNLDSSFRPSSDKEEEGQSILTFFLLIMPLVALIVMFATGSIVLGILVAIGQFLVVTFVAAFRAYKQNRLTRRKWVGILAAELVVIAALFQFLQYKPALMPAPGYALHHVTEPGWLNGRFKTIYALTEQTPCTHTLLGWQEETYFFYETDCTKPNQLWRYDVVAEQSEKISTLPKDLYTNAVPSTSIVEAVLADVYPREYATVSRGVYIAGDAFLSPNGRYTALIAQHIYGPQDILLLTQPVSN